MKKRNKKFRKEELKSMKICQSQRTLKKKTKRLRRLSRICSMAYLVR